MRKISKLGGEVPVYPIPYRNKFLVILVKYNEQVDINAFWPCIIFLLFAKYFVHNFDFTKNKFFSNHVDFNNFFSWVRSYILQNKHFVDDHLVNDYITRYHSFELSSQSFTWLVSNYIRRSLAGAHFLESGTPCTVRIHVIMCILQTRKHFF